MKETSSISISVSFRLPEEGETPNWLAWFDNKKDEYIAYAKDMDQMDQVMGEDFRELERNGEGELHKIVFEKNGIPVDNKV